MSALNFTLALCLLLVSATPAVSAEKIKIELPTETSELKPGEHRDLVFSSCLVCHSWDYVTIQPPLPRAAWKATVTKMRNTFGAPFAENQINEIVDYLAKAYGEEQRPDRTKDKASSTSRTTGDMVPKK